MFDLDELLGRAELKERIDDLEAEAEHLENRYEAEAERRADAATARQEAEQRVNRLEDRIAQLEGELERVEDDETGLDVRRREQLRGARLETVLDRLRSLRTDSEGALTAVLEDGDGVRDVLGADGDSRGGFGAEETDKLGALEGLEDVLGERIALLEDAAPCVCCVDDAGLVSVTLEPPVLPTDGALESGWNDRFTLEREWFLPTGRYALALVRADLFALGIYDGDERIDYRGFESDVKGSHSKGGFSQARFERIRNEQIDDHLERCRETLAEHVGGSATGSSSATGATAADSDRGANEASDNASLADGAGVDRLFLVGQRGVVDTLAEEASLEPDATAAVDATGDPKPALEDAHHSFWTTELRVL